MPEEMKDRLTRREFISRGALAATALSAFLNDSRAEAPGPPQRVIVVGAGLAGLSAAYELTRAGHEVRVLEAQSRTGGRVLTLRDKFPDGLYAEAGATRIHKGMDLTIKYAKLFNLRLTGFYPTDDRFIRLRGGRREVVRWKRMASDVEKFALRLDQANQWFRIEGGNDQLPQAFERKLADKIIYNSPVVGIEQDSNGVRVRFSTHGSQQTITADRALFAIPATILARIDASPPFSAAKQQTLEKLTYDSASRVFLQCRGRFWEGQNLNGFGVTDQPAEIWASSFGQPGVAGILQSYTRGDVSLRLTRQTEKERISSTLDMMERVFPGARENLELGISKCWSEDEWTRGAWAHTDEKQLKQLAQPEGRIHFAGEHISSQPSWMQGALESGERAAREILQVSRIAITRMYLGGEIDVPDKIEIGNKARR
ncbi:MAG TPA: FAD-dependent oxidoreductase [Blastocatellia bacterium]|nr:FAD-dependent oxidoreductase [Blastocatellia bacterium]